MYVIPMNNISNYDKNLFHILIYVLCMCVSVDIFSALENGVDVFDSSCVYSATERGCAVVFPIKHKAQRQKLIQQLEKQGEGDRVDDDDGECDTPLPLEIDLNEERYVCTL